MYLYHYNSYRIIVGVHLMSNIFNLFPNFTLKL